MLQPDMRDVPRTKPVSMAEVAPPAPVTFVPDPAPQPVVVARAHVVARGDTLYAVARRNNVEPMEVAKLNGLAPPYTIAVGRVLRLPGEVQAASPGVTAEVPAAIQAAALARQPPAGAAAPDTAPRGSVQVAALPPPDLKPAESRPPETRVPEARTAEARPAAAPPPLPAPGPAPAVAAIPPAPPPEPANTAVPAPPPRSASGFLMPVEGRIILGFGPQPGGLSNDGINIAAPRGAPVKAAEHGVVVYAGNELRGFGNMLLIRHEGGWMTAYAHLATMAVMRGTKVERGQPIGTVGMTGNVTSPQLHFEIRQGKQPVDPEKQIAGIPARTAQLGAAR